MGPTDEVFSLSYSKLNSLTLEMMSLLAEADVDVGNGAASAALLLGRLMAPRILEQDEEIVFVQAAIDWAGMFWPEGEVS